MNINWKSPSRVVKGCNRSCNPYNSPETRWNIHTCSLHNYIISTKGSLASHCGVLNGTIKHAEHFLEIRDGEWYSSRAFLMAFTHLHVVTFTGELLGALTTW